MRYFIRFSHETQARLMPKAFLAKQKEQREREREDPL
jgi:hypothetical protein